MSYMKAIRADQEYYYGVGLEVGEDGDSPRLITEARNILDDAGGYPDADRVSELLAASLFMGWWHGTLSVDAVHDSEVLV